MNDMKPPRWLVILICLTLMAIALPVIGILVPSLEWLRGFFYAWTLLLFAWVLVAFYHALKFITRG
jgi:hypothetical protein